MNANAANVIVGLRLPIEWQEVGLGPNPTFGGVSISKGSPAWMWSGAPPALPIVSADVPEGLDVPGWRVDHVVVTTANLGLTVERLKDVGADFRRQTEVKCTPTAFLIAGPLVEVIEASPMDVHLYGTALETDEPLDEVAAKWRAAGWDAGEPHDAVQPGRRIFSVPSKHLAVMTPRNHGEAV
jgi:hypothetical protein